mmetsp:Transcript_26852/g.68336  ORF Transcript_26852/g.68336 Transcript_26852/m.68336 type:complete len:243 (-) Transcript_26852:688-1416(-)
MDALAELPLPLALLLLLLPLPPSVRAAPPLPLLMPVKAPKREKAATVSRATATRGRWAIHATATIVSACATATPNAISESTQPTREPSSGTHDARYCAGPKSNAQPSHVRARPPARMSQSDMDCSPRAVASSPFAPNRPKPSSASSYPLPADVGHSTSDVAAALARMLTSSRGAWRQPTRTQPTRGSRGGAQARSLYTNAPSTCATLAPLLSRSACCTLRGSGTSVPYRSALRSRAEPRARL